MMLALSRKKAAEFITVTYDSSRTITIPNGVTVLTKVVGKGADGSGAFYNEGTVTVSSVGTNPNQSGGNSLVRSDVFNPGAVETEKFRGSGDRSVTYIRRIYTVGPDNLITSSSLTRTVRVRGDRISSSFIGGAASSAITYDNPRATVSVRIILSEGGTTGASASGFGKSFPGGVGGAAETLTFDDVSVTGGAPYQLVIPTGASISITYRKP